MRSIVLAACASGAAAALSIPLGTEFGLRPSAFVDISHEIRAWANPLNTSQNVAVDENGYPLGDAFTVVFDQRAAFAWAPPCDDPLCWGAQVNGTYYFNLTGFANVSLGSDPGQKNVSITSQTFDPVTFTTAGTVVVAPGAPALLIMQFTQTKRNASAPVGSGFTGLRIIQPGYAPDATQIFIDQMAGLMTPFNHARFMGITGTNTNPGYYGDMGHHVLNWTDNNRCLVTDAIIGSGREGCWGLPWERVVSFAQETGKGVWVNVPVSASGSFPVDTSSYLYNMAALFKNGNAYTGGAGVPDGTVIYVEHSNEVWNFGFGQYIWNKLAAIDECTAPNTCPYNNDGSTDQEVWARRRHIKVLFDIVRNWEAVFGAGSLKSIVRGVFAWWPLFPDQYNDTLTWFNATYGPPSDYFYGMAITGYFGQTPGANDGYDAIFAKYENSSTLQMPTRATFAALAAHWGLKLVAYEAGPGWDVGQTTDIGNVVMAQRQAGMANVVAFDITQSWVPAGGQEYNYFSLGGEASRFGQWGAIEDWHNTTTPKYCALVALTGKGAC